MTKGRTLPPKNSCSIDRTFGIRVEPPTSTMSPTAPAGTAALSAGFSLHFLSKCTKKRHFSIENHRKNRTEAALDRRQNLLEEVRAALLEEITRPLHLKEIRLRPIAPL